MANRVNASIRRVVHEHDHCGRVGTTTAIGSPACSGRPLAIRSSSFPGSYAQRRLQMGRSVAYWTGGVERESRPGPSAEAFATTRTAGAAVVSEAGHLLRLLQRIV